MPYGIVNTDTVRDSNGGILAPISSVFRNRLINSDMRIDQRNAGASVTNTASTTQYSLDRWNMSSSVASKYTVQQNAGSVTPPVGFTNYLGVTSLSAYSVGASEFFRIAQLIEGFNFADLGFGTANAKTVTVSFWVRSSLTGTFGGQLINGTGTRSYPFSYTISSANTWEQKSVTIAGDTTGTWATDNFTGAILGFSLGYGSSLSGTANAWNAGTASMPTGATSVVGTNGATFYITGVQLEVGSSATGFEYVNYQTSLANCQRYFVKTYGQSVTVPTNNSGGFLRTRSYSTSYGAFVWLLPVTMRTAPTAVIYNFSTSAVNSWYNVDTPSSVAANVSTTGEQSITVESSALTVNATYEFHLTGSSEL
jgi:hypothetical protein